jgi:hypothetical protein
MLGRMNKKGYYEHVRVALVKGTLRTIEMMKRPDETRDHFIRNAIAHLVAFASPR